MTRFLIAAIATIALMPGLAHAQARPGAQKPVATAAAPINLNTATMDQLESIPGIGAKTAERIIAYRQKNGGFKKIEEDRILQSILRVIERSGLKIEDVPVKHQEWGVNMREKIKAIGWDGIYVPYRIGSHAVHGSWVDILMRHLVYSDEGFSVEWSFGFTDGRLLNSSAQLNLEAAGYYAGRWFEVADRDAVFERLEPLIDDLEAVSHATELAVQRD